MRANTSWCVTLLALLALCSALPVSNKAAAPADSPPTTASQPAATAAKPKLPHRPGLNPGIVSRPPAAKVGMQPKPAASVPQQFFTLQQLKSSMLSSLTMGANHVQAMLKSVGVSMGRPDEWIFKHRDMHREYDEMTAWWCRMQQGSKPGAESALCAKRVVAARLKTMSGDAKRAALAQAKRDAEDPVKRKKVTDEAKRMVEAYCKAHFKGGGSDRTVGPPVGLAGVGGQSSICTATVSVLDMGKKFFNSTVKAPTAVPALPHKGPAATFPL